MLTLREIEPIASGSSRLVFRHPENPRLLVKVLRPKTPEKKPWFKVKRRFGPYLGLVRECEEFVAAHAAHGSSQPFLQTVVGLEKTDYGLGVVLEAILDPKDNLAPTLWALINSGRYDDRARAALEVFFLKLLDSSVVIADLHPGNLVYAEAETENPYFVLIDGFGVSNLIPFKAWFPRLNSRSKAKRIAILRARIAAKLMMIAAKGTPHKGTGNVGA